MAEFNGNNYGKIYSNVPSEAIGIGEFSGKVKMLFDSFTCEQNVYAINDIVKMGAKLPKGARVLEAVLVSPSLGTTGIMQLGFANNGVDVADPDAFIASADAGGADVKALMPAGAAGLGKKFEAETEIQIKFTEASDAANGLEIKAWLLYVLD